MNCWYCKKDLFNIDIFKNNLLSKTTILNNLKNNENLNQISNCKTNISDKYSYRNKIDCPNEYLDKLTIKRYSDNTQKTYIAYFKDFIHFFENRDLTTISKEESTAIFCI